MEQPDIASMIGTYMEWIGGSAKDLIIQLAEFLTLSESRPGVIATILILALLVFCTSFIIRTGRQRKVILEMDRMVRENDGIDDFAKNYSSFRKRVHEKSKSNGDWAALWEAWDEFNETIVPDDIDGPLKLRNSIRPASFMNIEDLGFGPGLYRILPNTFVSLGLFLTFLGLVAALHQFSQSMAGAGSGMDMAMQGFMQIASAKFIMSLAGLFCSIIFTVLLRKRINTLDRALHRLCIGIERRLVFVSLEDIGFRQLRAATEQREHLREIGMGMVAELQKPLEALPDRITGAIAERMDPIFDRVSSIGTSNMEGLVGDLSTHLSQSVGNALTRPDGDPPVTGISKFRLSAAKPHAAQTQVGRAGTVADGGHETRLLRTGRPDVGTASREKFFGYFRVHGGTVPA